MIFSAGRDGQRGEGRDFDLPPFPPLGSPYPPSNEQGLTALHPGLI